MIAALFWAGYVVVGVVFRRVFFAIMKEDPDSHPINFIPGICWPVFFVFAAVWGLFKGLDWLFFKSWRRA